MTEVERNQLAEDNLDLARLFASQRRQQGKRIGLDYEELESIGFEALVIASRKFDPSRSANFRTLAYLRMLDVLRSYRRKYFTTKRGSAQERRGFVGDREKELVRWDGRTISEAPDHRPEVRDLIDRIEKLAGKRDWEFLKRRFIDGLSNREVGEKFGLLQASVWNKQQRLCKELQAALADSSL